MTNKLDLLIINGRIIDGAGNPYYEADIAVVIILVHLIAQLVGTDPDEQPGEA
jgi:N-acyl-D-aspartate/D-glutamate deacylase